ncbi:MAG: hypothetical protein EXR50_07665 [Dehalococcoidia bacterium]|nr:hypothetical protein [Dehalococcoidia bacterium]
MERIAFIIGGIITSLLSFLVLFQGSPVGRVAMARANLPMLDASPYAVAVCFTLIFIVGFILTTGGFIPVSGIPERFCVGALIYMLSGGVFGAYGISSSGGALTAGVLTDITFIRFCISWPYQIFAAAFNAPNIVL